MLTIDLSSRPWRNIVAYNLACGFFFPWSSLLQGPIEGNGSRIPAVHDAATAVPAFIRMENDRRAPIFGIGNIDVHLAYIDADVAACAKISTESHRRTRSRHIGLQLLRTHREYPGFVRPSVPAREAYRSFPCRWFAPRYRFHRIPWECFSAVHLSVKRIPQHALVQAGSPRSRNRNPLFIYIAS